MTQSFHNFTTDALNENSSPDETLRAKIREEQIRLLRRGFTRMVVVLALCLLVFLSLCWQPELLVAGLLCLSGAAALEVLRTAYQQRSTFDGDKVSQSHDRRIALFNGLNFGCGLTLAFVTTLLIPAPQMLDVVVLFTMMAITVFSSAILYSTYLPAYYSFALPLVFGVTCWIWAMAPKDLHSLAMAGPILLLAVSRIAGLVNRLSTSALTRQFTHQAMNQRLFDDNCRQVSARKESEERLQYFVHHDELTGLANRNLLQTRLCNIVTREGLACVPIAVMMINIDRFRIINTALGHTAGDILLRQISQRLLSITKDANTTARFSSDQFTLILDKNTDTNSLKALAEILITRLSEAYTIDDNELMISASIGISCFPEYAKEAQTLMTQADLAMNQAKCCGGNSVQFFHEVMNSISKERLALESNLRQAISEKQLEVYYQPKIDLANGHITSAEALIRWHHPTMGMVLPGVFIPIAEEIGRINHIGNFVLEESCKHALHWLKQGWEIKVSINIAANHLTHGGLVNTVEHLLRESGLPPHLLELELTESQLMDDIELAIVSMNQLRELGISLSIDDFGTGYSSFSYIKRLPIDILKIDRTFISHIHENGDDCAIVRTIIDMAHSLGLKVVAEGVELEQHLHLLQEYGCDEAQGYHIGKPMPLTGFNTHFASKLNR